MEAKPRLPDAGFAAFEQAAALDARFGASQPEEIIARAVERFGAADVAAVSSFGADSAVLLDMIARVDRNLPVVFLDTGKHFGETLDYRDRLAADLGLTDIRVIEPDRIALSRVDPDGALHRTDTDGCCAVRKVEPMTRAVAPFKAWLTGRKRFQASTRQAMPVFEAVGERVRINPLARWDTGDLAAYMRRRNLRENPLVAYGYLSIGCFPCTEPAKPGEDARSGRWAGRAKTECGIHLPGLEAGLAVGAA